MTNPVKILLGNLKTILSFGSSNANKNVVTDVNGDLKVEDKNNHSHGNISSTGTLSETSKNVVTDGNGNITTEAKLIGSSTATDIKMNGPQSAGSSSNYAKADHVHPHDSSKLDANLTSANSGKYLKVDTNGDVVCSNDYGTFAELQGLINAATAGNTLILNKNYKNDGGESAIMVNKNLTIVGNGYTIDGDNQNAILMIGTNPTHVVIDNINFVNGYNNNGPFAISAYPSNTIITNCSFSNHGKKRTGVQHTSGAVFLRGGNNIVDNCSFDHNIANDGAAIYCQGTNDIINNCIFTDNDADQGIIYCQNSTKIYNCTFHNNSGDNIYSYSSGAVAYNCNITTGLHNCVNKDYLTDHQSLPDITGKEDLSNKVKSTSSISSTSTDDQYASAKLIYNTLLKSDSTVKNGHTHNEYLTSSSLTGYLTKTNADTYYQPIGSYLTSNDITGKLDKSQTSYKGKNVVVHSTSGEITFEDKNNHNHNVSDINGLSSIATSGSYNDLSNIPSIVEEFSFYWVDDYLDYLSDHSISFSYDPNTDIVNLVNYLNNESIDFETNKLYKIAYGSSYNHDIYVAFIDDGNGGYTPLYVTTSERYATLYELSLKATSSDISSAISIHDGNNSAHNDIRTALGNKLNTADLSAQLETIVQNLINEANQS